MELLFAFDLDCGLNPDYGRIEMITENGLFGRGCELKLNPDYGRIEISNLLEKGLIQK